MLQSKEQQLTGSHCSSGLMEIMRDEFSSCGQLDPMQKERASGGEVLQKRNGKWTLKQKQYIGIKGVECVLLDNSIWNSTPSQSAKES